MFPLKQHLRTYCVIFHPTDAECEVTLNVNQCTTHCYDDLKREAQQAFDGKAINYVCVQLNNGKYINVDPQGGLDMYGDGQEFHVSSDHDLFYETRSYRFGDLTKKAFGYLASKLHSNYASVYPEPPGPLPKPVAGNVPDILPEIWTATHKLLPIYGRIIKLQLLGSPLYIVSDPSIIESLLSSPDKLVPQPQLAGKGVFLADGALWKFARDTLTRSFTPTNIGTYIPSFQQKAAEVVEQFNKRSLESSAGVDVWEWSSRIMYDTICELGFNYQPTMVVQHGERDKLLHSFEYCAAEAKARVMRFPPLNALHHTKYHHELKKLNACLDEIIGNCRKECVKDEKNKETMLGILLNAHHPRTGKGMTDEEIRDQLLTLLVAGHATTQILISWALYLIGTRPDVEQDMYEEIVKNVDVDAPLTLAALNKLSFMDKVLKEVLRLFAPAQSAGRGLVEDMVVTDIQGNKYQLWKNSHCFISIYEMHRDPELWENASDFDPYRFTSDMFEAKSNGGKGLHRYQYIPFGGGPRLCIGNMFALTQVKTYLALLIVRFYIRNATSQVVQVGKGGNLVVPIDGIPMRFIARQSWTCRTPPPKVELKEATEVHEFCDENSVLPEYVGHGKRITIFWGSSNGVTKHAAEKLFKFLTSHDFEVTLRTINELNLNSQKEDCVVMSSTYNGTPPPNAAKVYKALPTQVERLVADAPPNTPTTPNTSDLSDKTLFCVAGFGHHNWHLTYQKVGKTLCSHLQKMPSWVEMVEFQPFDVGADWESEFIKWQQRILFSLAERASCDLPAKDLPPAGQAGLSDDFTERQDSTTTQAETRAEMRAKLKLNVDWTNTPASRKGYLSVEDSTNLFFDIRNMRKMKIRKRIAIVSYADRKTSHIQLVPIGNTELTYSTGDHVSIWPRNTEKTVQQLAQRLKLDQTIPLTQQIFHISSNHNELARWTTNTLCDVHTALSMYFDVTTPPTRAALNVFQFNATDPVEQRKLKDYRDNNYQTVLDSRLSTLDILTKFPSINIDFPTFSEVTPQQQPRYYSISSCKGSHGIDLTVGCLQYEIEGQKHVGLCSNYLTDVNVENEIDNVIYMGVHESTFRPHSDLSKPMIMICNGSGVAPFRGFIQERHQQHKSGKAVAKCHLFFGCRNDTEFLYREELENYQNDGVVELHMAYSRQPAVSKTYVYSLLLQEKSLVVQLVRKECAAVYICGAASTMAKDVMTTLASVLRKRSQTTEEVIDKMLDDGQLFLDVWG